MHQVNIPSSSSSVDVFIIDTTTRFNSAPVQVFGGPPIKGFELFNCVSYAFLVVHKDVSTGEERKILFDLGTPKNWQEDLPPHFVARVKASGAHIQVEKYVSEILVDSGIPLDTIEAVIWSHHHWDHIGRPSLFHPSTTLITGNGVKEALFPGYPERVDSLVLSREFQGREIKELDFSQPSTVTIGSFRAIDYFKDGSFYLLDAPGHCVGHINGLARTTAGSDPSFILMGADSYHHASQLRPHKYLELPDSASIPNFTPYPCPGELLQSLHPNHPDNQAQIPPQYQSHFKAQGSSRLSPFLTIAVAPNGTSVGHNVDAARKTINDIQEFDADERVLVVAAHDASLIDIMEYLPAKANDWKRNGWKESGRWKFLEDFTQALTNVNKL